MKLNIVALGKNKHSYLEGGIELYLNRIRHFNPIKLVELKEKKTSNQTLKNTLEKTLFLNRMSESAYPICLHEKGRQFDSKGLAQFLQKTMNSGVKDISFFIGGPYGFDQEVLNKSKFNLSLSSYTYPHDLCRLILLEQIYRSFTILHNIKYHNE